MVKQIQYRSEKVSVITEVIEYSVDGGPFQSIYMDSRRDPCEGMSIAHKLLLKMNAPIWDNKRKYEVKETPDDEEWEGVIIVSDDLAQTSSA